MLKKKRVISDWYKSYEDRFAEGDPLTREEVVRLAIRRDRGDRSALETIISNNMALVVMIVRDFVPVTDRDFDDLVQEGAIGLQRAAELFNPWLGYRFSTYATHHIGRSVRRALHNKRTVIRIPSWCQKLIRDCYVACRDSNLEFSPNNIVFITGMKPQRVREIWGYYLTSKTLSFDQLSEAWNRQEPVSLLKRIPVVNEYDDINDNISVRELINSALASLSPKARDVIYLRYLCSDERVTHGEIGTILGLSRARIQQYEIRAIKELRRLLAPYRVKKRS